MTKKSDNLARAKSAAERAERYLSGGHLEFYATPDGSRAVFLETAEGLLVKLATGLPLAETAAFCEGYAAALAQSAGDDHEFPKE